MRHTQLINYGLYQIGWFACVLGGAWHRPWTGFLIAVILGGTHLTLSVERSIEARLVVFAIAVGALVEMGQIAAGTYRFTSGTVIDALPPPWLLAMWAQFATTFRFSLRTIMTRPIRAALFGAVGGPIAFLAGERLGAVSLSPPLTQGLLRLSISWAIALVVFSVVVRRLTRNGTGLTVAEGGVGSVRGLLVGLYISGASGSRESGATRGDEVYATTRGHRYRLGHRETERFSTESNKRGRCEKPL